MLKSEMSFDQYIRFHDWANTEWARCNSLRSNFENHAITYLMTGNGGGAATVIALAGSAGFANKLVYWALILFMIGLISTGFGIASALRRMSSISTGLMDDYKLFNSTQKSMDSKLIEDNHNARFRRRTLGFFFGWIAFGLFLSGITVSGFAFNSYLNLKNHTDSVESASAVVGGHEVPLSPSRGDAGCSEKIFQENPTSLRKNPDKITRTK